MSPGSVAHDVRACCVQLIQIIAVVRLIRRNSLRRRLRHEGSMHLGATHLARKVVATLLVVVALFSPVASDALASGFVTHSHNAYTDAAESANHAPADHEMGDPCAIDRPNRPSACCLSGSPTIGLICAMRSFGDNPPASAQDYAVPSPDILSSRTAAPAIRPPKFSI